MVLGDYHGCELRGAKVDQIAREPSAERKFIRSPGGCPRPCAAAGGLSRLRAAIAGLSHRGGKGGDAKLKPHQDEVPKTANSASALTPTDRSPEERTWGTRVRFPAAKQRKVCDLGGLARGETGIARVPVVRYDRRRP